MRIVASTILAVMGVACAGGSTDTLRATTKVVEPPLKEVTIYGSRVSVQLQPGVPLAEVVDMTVFDRFKPDTSPAVYGESTDVRRDHRGMFHGYETARGRVEVAKESRSDSVGLGSPSPPRLTVYAYPKDNLVEKLFHAKLAALVKVEHPTEVIVMSSSGDRILVAVSGDVAQSLRWYHVKD